MADKQDKSELKAELERKKQRLAQIREEKKRKEEEKNKKKDVSRENRRMILNLLTAGLMQRSGGYQYMIITVSCYSQHAVFIILLSPCPCHSTNPLTVPHPLPTSPLLPVGV